MPLTDTQKQVAKAFYAAGLDPAFACAIIEHETGGTWNPASRSPKTASDEKYGGAFGLCQMLLPTAQKLGYKGTGEGMYEISISIDLFLKLTKQNSISAKGSVPDLVTMHNSGRTFGRAPFGTLHDYLPAVLKHYADWREKLKNGEWK